MPDTLIPEQEGNDHFLLSIDDNFDFNAAANEALRLVSTQELGPVQMRVDVVVLIKQLMGVSTQDLGASVIINNALTTAESESGHFNVDRAFSLLRERQRDLLDRKRQTTPNTGYAVQHGS